MLRLSHARFTVNMSYQLQNFHVSFIVNTTFLSDYIFHLVSKIVRLSTQPGQAANPLMSAVHGHKGKDFQLHSQ